MCVDRLDSAALEVINVFEHTIRGETVVTLLHAECLLGRGVARVTVCVTGEALVAAEVLDADIGCSALLAVTVLHGAEWLILFEFNDAGHVVALHSFFQHWRVSEGVDLAAFDGLVSRDGDLAAAKHFAVGGGCPRLQVE